MAPEQGSAGGWERRQSQEKGRELTLEMLGMLQTPELLGMQQKLELLGMPEPCRQLLPGAPGLSWPVPGSGAAPLPSPSAPLAAQPGLGSSCPAWHGLFPEHIPQGGSSSSPRDHPKVSPPSLQIPQPTPHWDPPHPFPNNSNPPTLAGKTPRERGGKNHIWQNAHSTRIWFFSYYYFNC